MLFVEFVYEVIRGKMIIGNNEFADRDVGIFFKNKQEQDEKVASRRKQLQCVLECAKKHAV